MVIAVDMTVFMNVSTSHETSPTRNVKKVEADLLLGTSVNICSQSIQYSFCGLLLLCVPCIYFSAYFLNVIMLLAAFSSFSFTLLAHSAAFDKR